MMKNKEQRLHEIFGEISSAIEDAFNDYIVDINHIGRNFFIEITDLSNEIRVTLTFHDETMYDPANISEVTDEKIENSQISYTVSGQYIKEHFDPGYLDQGNIHKSVSELCFEMYEKVMDMKEELVENEEREYEMYEEFKEGMKFKKADMSDRFLVDITMNSDSIEDFELLSGAKNMTTLN